jgi:sugar lactone lactonase YvrE
MSASSVGEPAKGKKPTANAARVWKVVPGQKPVVHAGGFNTITGVAFDQDGSLYVTEWSIKPLDRNNAKGDVVKVAPDGSRSRLGLGELFFPAGAAVGPDGALYVSNWSILPGTPAKGGPFKGKSGQLVRIIQ